MQSVVTSWSQALGLRRDRHVLGYHGCHRGLCPPWRDRVSWDHPGLADQKRKARQTRVEAASVSASDQPSDADPHPTEAAGLLVVKSQHRARGTGWLRDAGRTHEPDAGLRRANRRGRNARGRGRHLVERHHELPARKAGRNGWGNPAAQRSDRRIGQCRPGPTALGSGAARRSGCPRRPPGAATHVAEDQLSRREEVRLTDRGTGRSGGSSRPKQPAEPSTMAAAAEAAAAHTAADRWLIRSHVSPTLTSGYTPSTMASTARAACDPASSNRWPYLSSVNDVEECPSRLEITSGCSPAAIR